MRQEEKKKDQASENTPDVISIHNYGKWEHFLLIIDFLQMKNRHIFLDLEFFSGFNDRD